MIPSVELPSTLYLTGACYCICWEKSGESVKPKIVYGSHPFLSASDWLNRQGDDSVARFLSESSSRWSLLDIGSANPLEFDRKEAAVLTGIANIVFATCWAGSILELGFDYLVGQKKEKLDLILDSVLSWSAVMRPPPPAMRPPPPPPVPHSFLEMIPEADHNAALSGSSAAAFLCPECTSSQDEDEDEDGAGEGDMGNEGIEGYPGFESQQGVFMQFVPRGNCKHFERAAACSDVAPCQACLHCEMSASGEPCLFCPCTPERTKTKAKSISIHALFAAQWMAKNCWRPPSCVMDTPGCFCHSCTFLSGMKSLKMAPKCDDSEPPSRGSIGHPYRCAPACKFTRRERGCQEEKDCDHCHLCTFSRSGARQERQRVDRDGFSVSRRTSVTSATTESQAG